MFSYSIARNAILHYSDIALSNTPKWKHKRVYTLSARTHSALSLATLYLDIQSLPDYSRPLLILLIILNCEMGCQS